MIYSCNLSDKFSIVEDFPFMPCIAVDATGKEIPGRITYADTILGLVLVQACKQTPQGTQIIEDYDMPGQLLQYARFYPGPLVLKPMPQRVLDTTCNQNKEFRTAQPAIVDTEKRII